MMHSNEVISRGFLSTFFQFKVKTPASLIKCPSLPVPPLPIADALKAAEVSHWLGGREEDRGVSCTVGGGDPTPYPLLSQTFSGKRPRALSLFLGFPNLKLGSLLGWTPSSLSTLLESMRDSETKTQG